MSTRKRHRNSALPARLTGLALLTLAIYLALALRERTTDWWGLLHGGDAGAIWGAGRLSGPLGGAAGLTVHAALGGLWCWLLPVWLAWRGARLLWWGERSVAARWERWIWLLVLLSSGWLAVPGGPAGSVAAGARLGGAPGYYLALGLSSLVGRLGAQLFLGLGTVTALLLLVEPWLGPVDRLWRGAGGILARLGGLLASAGTALGRTLRRGGAAAGHALRALLADRDGEAPPPVTSVPGTVEDAVAEDAVAEETVWPGEPSPAQGTGTGETPAASAETGRSAGQPLIPAQDPAPVVVTRRRRGGGSVSTVHRRSAVMDLPPLSLLVDPEPSDRRVSPDQLREASALLEEKLRTFGVEGRVRNVRPGPVVTTFEFKPAPGVTVNAVVRRADDLALAMSARSIRIQAPLPGTDAVGIELPNPVQEMVRLKEVLQAAGDSLRHPLDVALGRDAFGEPVVIDLAAQPHLLVAGATGSGKSVCINAMIVSLLMRCSPQTVRLLLIDPKMLELNAYNGIPHLLHPVITAPKAALRALKWLEAEMDQRYRRLARHGVRNIEGYNRKVASGEIAGPEGEPEGEPMPYFVCIVDELADLMMQLGQEIELPITRLAQKARAIGIHLVLATQRPSVDVLTGVIKANIPCRIAFRVIQRNDSRTILDANGAEKLLGKGDMLYLEPGEAKPRRVHGAYVDVTECEAVAGFWRDQGTAAAQIDLAEEAAAGDDKADLEMDPLFERAREIVVLSQHGSTSMLQRKLGIGYARAGRLMDLLERHGVVGPFVGSKAREVLLRPEDLDTLAKENEEGGEDA